MKRTTFLIASVALLLAFTSCSKSNDTKTILPVTVTNSGLSSTATYNGTQLVATTDSLRTMSFTYANGLIASNKITEKGVVTLTANFTYSNGKLSSEIEIQGNGTGSTLIEGTKYTYNADGSVLVNTGLGTSSDLASVTWDTTHYTICTLNSAGDIAKSVSYYFGVARDSAMYEYDTHPTPLINIAGMKEQAIKAIGDGRFHNVTKATYTTTTRTTSYTYDSSTGYPLTVTNGDGVTTYTYNN